ncbi:MAG: nitroreductase family protein [Spirochaetales bacterium]|nr:nitroreductase family protein [Spirochaetales bacterium]
MIKNKKILSIILLILLGSFVHAQEQDNEVLQVIKKSYSTKYFSERGSVSEKALEDILLCGIKAPSARNSQLWRFVVLTDSPRTKTLLGKRVGNVSYTPGAVYIIVCGAENEPKGIDVDFDCALAAENMYIAAQSMGFGAHMYTSPVKALNTNLRGEVPLPKGYRAVCLIKIGNTDTDAVSSASPRNALQDVVEYR